MGATVHTPLPDDRHERFLADRIVPRLSEDWHLWFNLQRGAGTEIDIFAVNADAGCLCIEVKGYEPQSIDSYSDDEIVVSGRAHRHPLKQAQRAQWGLLDFLQDRGLRKGRDLPYLYLSAAFPRIERSAMYDAFGSTFERHFEGMLFDDDIHGDTGAALLRIARNPPISGAARHSPPGKDAVRRLLDVLDQRVLRHRQVNPGVAASFARIHRAAVRQEELDLGVEPEHGRASVRESWEKYLAPGASIHDNKSRVVFHGKPGTGKTTDLLRIALAHALAGQQVLVCCYNKVLASDLRARVATLPDFHGTRGNLLIRDVYDIAAVTSVFDTICVDEAQDFEARQFGLLASRASRTAEWFLADSPDQALYGGRSRFLDDAVDHAKANGTWETLRLSRRASALVAQAGLECSPDLSQIPRWVARHPMTGTRVSRGDTPLFDDLVDAAGTVLLPSIWTMGESGTSDPRLAVEVELERAAARGVVPDLAVVTFRATGIDDQLEGIKAALKDFGLAYLDQIDPDNRRVSPEPGQVRIVSAHSSRGIEADRVVLIGLDDLDHIRANQNTLLNIALTRARHGTTIVLPGTREPGKHRAFVAGLVAAYQAAAVTDA
ncbi:MAG TPA: NERD domain-containing protein [Nocardioides sp.]|nr:NERD domain-containing protein [Nocardioides sp.]